MWQDSWQAIVISSWDVLHITEMLHLEQRKRETNHSSRWMSKLMIIQINNYSCIYSFASPVTLDETLIKLSKQSQYLLVNYFKTSHEKSNSFSEQSAVNQHTTSKYNKKPCPQSSKKCYHPDGYNLSQWLDLQTLKSVKISQKFKDNVVK